MASDIDEDALQRRYATIVVVAAVTTALLAAVALAGWWLEVPALAGGSDVHVPMAPNTALAFLALVLAVFAVGSRGVGLGVAWAAVGLVSGVALLTMLEFFLERGIGVDSVLFDPGGAIGDIPLGVMSPYTSALFLVMASAVAFRLRGAMPQGVALAGVIVSALGLVVVLGYVYGRPLIYGGATIPMALTTGAAFVSMGTALTVSVGPRPWPASALLGEDVRARLLRGFLPPVIGLVLLQIGLSSALALTPLGHPALQAGVGVVVSLMIVGAVVARTATSVAASLASARSEARRFEEEARVVGRAKTIVAEQLSVEAAERARAEAALQSTQQQLQLAQKMEAVGRLAGGVAHDFNNLLSIIMMQTDVVQSDLAPDDWRRGELDEVKTAVDRAAALTRQLLTFSRRQVVEPVRLDIDDLVRELSKMLGRLIGEDIDFRVRLAGALPLIRIDRSQLEQVILNLVVNARDAMPGGGTLTITTGTEDLGEDYAREHVGIAPGRHVMLSVSDTGTGMDRDTQARIFEPFFTTKGEGKGTGLGLATVYGIVKQSGGSIWVYSEPGRGTVFKIYLPAIREDEVVPETGRVVRAPSLGGTETVLLVEDEEGVRRVARRALEARGYVVLDAGNAEEARTRVREHDGPVHALLTDVVLPHESGVQLAIELRASLPELRVVFMSGYPGDAAVRIGEIEYEGFIQKPLAPGLLTETLRAALDR